MEKRKPTHGNKAPATNDGSKKLTTADVDVLWAEGHEIIGRADGVGRDVDTKGDDEQADGAKGSSCSATVGPRFHPEADNYDRVPDDLAIRRLGGRGSENAKQANNG